MAENSNTTSSISSELNVKTELNDHSKPNTTTSIPIASIKKNRKLTLGEIEEVHNCTLIDGKLAFIVTLRSTNSIAKVFRNDINTNSLRHAVPFSSLCNKYGCKNVNELEQKLINNNSNSNSNNKDISHNTKETNTIEVSCDASTSLKHLASIASVVNKNNNGNNNDNDNDSDITEEESESESESSHSQPQPQPQSKSNTITYNLRSKNKKRKFRELNDEDNQSVNAFTDTSDMSDSMNENSNNSNNNNNNNILKYKRPNFLRPIPLLPIIPNTVSVGPSLSPHKSTTGLRNLDINNIKRTSSAPNTPILNGNVSNRQIINLINSPSTKTLQFPQISLPCPQNTIQTLTLFPALNGITGMNGNYGMNGINNLNAKSLQQLQQLMLLQKRMNQTNLNNNNNINHHNNRSNVNMNTNNSMQNNIITKITNLNPIQMLPRLESETETQSKPTNVTKEPPTKKLKLCNGNSLHINRDIHRDEEPFWTERLRLDGILNTHKVCEKQMQDLDSMRNWTHIIRTLQGQRLELLKVQQSIYMQWQSYHIEANRYNTQLQQIIKHNEPKNNQYQQLKLKIDDYKKQITEIYEKISKLSVKRKVLEKQLQSANHSLSKCQINMQQINNASKQFKKFINDRKEKATKLVEFMKTIDVISKKYCTSVENMQKKVSTFEPKYKAWNSGEVVTWFENIDKGLLNKSQLFLKFKTQLITNNVSGKDLVNLNDFSLKMMGLKNDKERAVVIAHLNKLLIHSQESIDETCEETNNEPNEPNEPNDDENKNDDMIESVDDSIHSMDNKNMNNINNRMDGIDSNEKTVH